jgi:hypothetical protein
VSVMDVAQVVAVFKMGLHVGVYQVRVSKFGCSSLGVPIWVFNSGYSSQAVQVGSYHSEGTNFFTSCMKSGFTYLF